MSRRGRSRGICKHTKTAIHTQRSFPGNQHDSHALIGQLEQVSSLCQYIGVAPKTVVVDPGDRDVDADSPGEGGRIHQGKFKRLTELQRRWL